MIAVRTKFFARDLPDSLELTRLGIESRVPVSVGGYHRRDTSYSASAQERFIYLGKTGLKEYAKIDPNWHLQIGTLGSGNHFIELCLDEKDRLWAVLHSGSRGIGNKLAMRHIKVAQKLMDEGNVELKDRDLAYLNEGTPEFDAYIRDLLWAQRFALENRDEMMDQVMAELSYVFYDDHGHQKEIELERINCHHNFTQKEHHFDADVWLTRKGAIQMDAGRKGVIPGSMGTRSYIVSGLGNADAYCSAPHGAGRRFSRGETRRRFTMEDLEQRMKGIECRLRPSLIDEIDDAYKDIDVVMESSKNLVRIEHTLRQVLNIKGD